MEQTAGGPVPATIDPGEIRRAQLGEYARLTPINTFVTLSVSTCTALILRPFAPRPWLLVWLGVQVLPSLLLLARWLRRKSSLPAIRPVPVGAIRACEFIADNPGDWPFHCHKKCVASTTPNRCIPSGVWCATLRRFRRSTVTTRRCFGLALGSLERKHHSAIRQIPR
jgi:hypothetical protein